MLHTPDKAERFRRMSWLQSLFLGVVQGVTEFLPISSDGHLALFQILLGGSESGHDTGAENLFFDVMLHVGTAAAILAHYRVHIRDGLRGLLGESDVPEGYRRSQVIRVGILAFVATLPLVPDALIFKPWIEETFQSLTAVGVGFLITACVLLVTMRLNGGQRGPDRTTWVHALIIGVAQAFAPLPGVSRSGLTIATALGLGFSRTWAVGFSLMMAVPAIFGAAVFELRKVDPALLTPDRIARILASAAVAGLVGYAAIFWLVRVVRSGRLWYFSVYLIVLGALALGLSASRGGGRSNAGNAPVVDRAERLEPARPRARRESDQSARALARPDAALSGAGRVGVGPPESRRVGRTRLDLGGPLV